MPLDTKFFLEEFFFLGNTMNITDPMKRVRYDSDKIMVIPIPAM